MAVDKQARQVPPAPMVSPEDLGSPDSLATLLQALPARVAMPANPEAMDAQEDRDNKDRMAETLDTPTAVAIALRREPHQAIERGLKQEEIII